jgi:NADPH-dependent curcumin reductase CurA
MKWSSGSKREIVFEGLENSSNALISLFNGENFGKTLVT